MFILLSKKRIIMLWLREYVQFILHKRMCFQWILYPRQVRPKLSNDRVLSIQRCYFSHPCISSNSKVWKFFHYWLRLIPLIKYWLILFKGVSSNSIVTMLDLALIKPRNLTYLKNIKKITKFYSFQMYIYWNENLEKYVCFSNEIIDFRLDPLQLLDSDVQF